MEYKTNCRLQDHEYGLVGLLQADLGVTLELGVITTQLGFKVRSRVSYLIQFRCSLVDKTETERVK